jgi:rhodanese-related sulfurtransferase
MRRKHSQHLVQGAVCVVAWAGLPALADEGFPLREKFPQVQCMAIEALNRDYQKTIVVDVRARIEYDVIRINKAIHIPVATALFTKDLAKARDQAGSTPIAFYCNGHTCAKSYEAAEQAMAAGFQNVYAFDAGIRDWVTAHPEKTTLMGKTPAPLDQMISREMLKKRELAFAEFKKRAEGPDAMVVDVREPFQRKQTPQLPRLRNIPSDRFVELIAAGEFKGKQLLIMDAVGKQVEWIQYYLEQHGYTNYYFLDKGAAGALEAAAVE